MNLAALHTQVRTMVRDGSDSTGGFAGSPSERTALRAWRRRLARVGDRAARLIPPAGTAIWTATAVRVPQD
jgi:hypothetical protein